MLSFALGAAALYTIFKSTEKGTDKIRENLERENLQEELNTKSNKESVELNIEEAYYNKRMDMYIKNTFPNCIRWEYYYELMPDGYRRILQSWLQDKNIVHLFNEDGTDCYTEVWSRWIIPTQTSFEENELKVPSLAKQWLQENYHTLLAIKEEKEEKGYSSYIFPIEEEICEEQYLEIIRILQETTPWEVEKADNNAIFFSWDTGGIDL